MHQARSVSAEDFAGTCPVPFGLVARLTRAEPDTLAALLDGISEATRANLAVWLYGRSHTHALGVRVAATCRAQRLNEAAGDLVGTMLYDLSHRPYSAPDHGTRPVTGRRISLGGSGFQTSAL